MNTNKTIVIDRKYWGQGSLRNNRGLRCCLGFVCEAFGVSPKETINEGLPENSFNTPIKYLPRWLLDSDDVLKAARINDSNKIDYIKEKMLTRIFLRHNIKLVFRGKR